VDYVVVLAKDFERFAGEHQFNEQLRVPDGEVKFHEFVARLAADPDIAGHFVKGFFVGCVSHG
jgi:hypothetical protein